MTELVDETRVLLAATIPTTTQVTFSGQAQPMLVVGDRDRLQQVLINLCINAHDALGGQPGQVKISVAPTVGHGDAFTRLARGERDNPVEVDDVWVDASGTAHVAVGSFDPALSHVSLTVSDDGCGMDSLVLQHIFTPFFTTKNKGYGTGLGLSMVHGAVLAHRGALVVESRVGSGTTIEVVLPVSDESGGESVIDTSVIGSSLPPTGGRLLLVDDDPNFGDMLLTALERRGFEVSPFSDPLSAMVGLRRHRDDWDAVVADQIMPHMTGVDFIRAVRAECPDLPCILCSGYAEDSLDDESLKDAGIFALLRKPVDINELMEILSRAVAERGRAEKVGE